MYTCNTLINDSILSVHLPNISKGEREIVRARDLSHSFIRAYFLAFGKALVENITAVIVNDSNQMSNELRLTVINDERKRRASE